MSKYNPKNILEKEPAVISGAVVIVLNGLALFGVIDVTADQLAGVNAGTAALLALFTRSSVTPNDSVFVTKKQLLDAIPATEELGRLTDRLAGLHFTGDVVDPPE